MATTGKFDPKVDYLKEDPVLNGQNYGIVSFVNPKDAVTTKSLFYVNRFMVQDINSMITAQAIQMSKKLTVTMRERVNEVLDKLKASVDPEDKHMSKILEAKFRELCFDEDAYVEECRRKYEIDAEELTDKYKMFLSENRQKMDIEFDKVHDNMTSLRGFKIRGTFARIQDAKDRAKMLRDEVEPAIHTFIVPIGTWFPVDMEADEVQDQEYMLPQLNELMGKYHEGVHARNQHYQERKLELQQGGAKKSTKERLQDKLKQKKADQLKSDLDDIKGAGA